MASGGDKIEVQNAGEASSEVVSSEKAAPKSLKPKRKIVKKILVKKIVKKKKAEGSPHVGNAGGASSKVGSSETATPSSLKLEPSETATPSSFKPEPSETATPSSLKPKRILVKKTFVPNSAKAKKAKDSPQIPAKKKDVNSEGSNINASDGPKLEDKKLDCDISTHDRSKLKSTNNQKNGKKKFTSQKGSKAKDTTREVPDKIEAKSMDSQKGNKVESTKDKNTTTEEPHKLEEKELDSQMGNKEKGNTNQKHKTNQDQKKLGGLIFMCNAKTRPDCFRYGVMGVPLSKKDVVLSIRPGLKLFLYDFDQKLMYGIYEASSSGGMKLERSAFDGAFPVQVRFKVQKDCSPVPENAFKNAIKENYTSGEKFKAELTVQQVKKLTEIFKSPQQHQSHPHSDAHPDPTLHPLPMPAFALGDIREALPQVHQEPVPMGSYSVHESRRNSIWSGHDGYSRNYFSSDPEKEQLLHYPVFTLSQEQRDSFPRDPYSLDESRRNYALSEHEKDFYARHPPTILPQTQREPAARNFYSLDESRRSQIASDHEREQQLYYPASQVYKGSMPIDSYVLDESRTTYSSADQGREQQSHYPAPRHGDVAPKPKRAGSPEPLFLSEKEYRTYGLRRARRASPAPTTAPSPLDSYVKDPYYPYPHNDLSNSYSLPHGKQAIQSESYHLGPRTESYLSDPRYTDRGPTDYSRISRVDDMGGLYSTHASNVLSDYNQKQYVGVRAEPGSVPISSQYAFAGSSAPYK